MATAPATTGAPGAPQSSATTGSTNQSAVRAAEQRAKAAEARAERAEKAAAVSNAKARAKSQGAQRLAESAAERLAESAAVEDAQAPGSDPEPKATRADDPLADNVEVVDIPGVGKREAGVVDEVAYLIGKAETTKALGPDMYRREADGVFYVLQVVADNEAKITHNATTSLMKLVDDQGREFDPSTEGSVALAATGDQSAQLFSAQLQPGVTKKFTLVYDAPADAKGLKRKIPAGNFSFGKDVLIKVPTASE